MPSDWNVAEARACFRADLAIAFVAKREPAPPRADGLRLLAWAWADS
jgi:hypothetical protein